MDNKPLTIVFVLLFLARSAEDIVISHCEINAGHGEKSEIV